MCRHNQFWGFMLLAFGLGMLIGLWIEGGFFCHCLGFGFVFVGIGMANKNK